MAASLKNRALESVAEYRAAESMPAHTVCLLQIYPNLTNAPLPHSLAVRSAAGPKFLDRSARVGLALPAVSPIVPVGSHPHWANPIDPRFAPPSPCRSIPETVLG